MTSVKILRDTQKAFIASLNAFKLLSMYAKFQFNKYQLPTQKNMMPFL